MHTLLYRGGGEISPHLPPTSYSNFDASAANLEVLLLRLTGTQCEAVYYKRVSARVFCHFLCLAPDECSEATNWTADHACWMAYVSASNDPPVEARWQGRRRRGATIWHVNVPESLLFASLWSCILYYKSCGITAACRKRRSEFTFGHPLSLECRAACILTTLNNETQSVELNGRITASCVSKLKRYSRWWPDFCSGNPLRYRGSVNCITGGQGNSNSERCGRRN